MIRIYLTLHCLNTQNSIVLTIGLLQNDLKYMLLIVDGKFIPDCLFTI